MFIKKLWRVAAVKNASMPVFAFYWEDEHSTGEGRFIANSKRTYIRMSTDRRFRLKNNCRWSIQVQLLAHLRAIHPREFNQWLDRFYPNISRELSDIPQVTEAVRVTTRK